MKKNLRPQQQQPVMRFTVVKPLVDLSEENLTEGWSSSQAWILSQAADDMDPDMMDMDDPSMAMCSFYGDE